MSSTRRGKILEAQIGAMLRAWTGEPFEWGGRTVCVTPRPATQPHPMVLIGGATEKAARRPRACSRRSCPAGDPALAEVY